MVCQRNTGFFCVEQSCKENLVFSAEKMMKTCVVIAIYIMVCFSCEEHQWRGKKFWCCTNGTKFVTTSGKVIWSATVLVICEIKPVEKQKVKSSNNDQLAWLTVVLPLILFGCAFFGYKCYRRLRNAQEQ